MADNKKSKGNRSSSSVLQDRSKKYRTCNHRREKKEAGGAENQKQLHQQQLHRANKHSELDEGLDTDCVTVTVEDTSGGGGESGGFDPIAMLDKENRPVSSRLALRSRPASMRSSAPSSAKRTIPRSAKSRQRSRPQSTSTLQEENLSRLNDSDLSDAEDARTKAADLIEFGADIFGDQGWDTDLEIEVEDISSYDGSGRGVYLEACRNSDVIPVSYFLRHMHDTVLDMKHHGLGPSGAKPICVALVSNTQVTQLCLSDNWLGELGGAHVAQMLKENCYITEIDLSDNHLGVGFAERLIDVLQQNSTLTHIILSGNDLCDKAAIPLADAIMNTTRIEYMNLSRNKFGEAAGIALGPAISENCSIRHLDLSWNSIRRKGAVAIANGIKTNILVQKVNLSWNGMGVDGCKALGEALKHNSTLEELDLANNRITTEGAVLLGKGLTASETLKTLKIGKNPIQSSGCFAICAALTKNPNTLVEELDFTDILVNNDFLEAYSKLKEQLPTLKLRHGGDGMPKKPKARVHPMVKLKNYIDRNNLRLVDFFNKFDKDNSMSVTREEFAEGIGEYGIPLNPAEIDMLLDELDKDGDGEINYSFLCEEREDEGNKSRDSYVCSSLVDCDHVTGNSYSISELVMGHQDFTEKELKMASTILGTGDSIWKT